MFSRTPSCISPPAATSRAARYEADRESANRAAAEHRSRAAAARDSRTVSARASVPLPATPPRCVVRAPA
eukprot:11178835-Lingulodinium_polyedra.AAC.1